MEQYESPEMEIVEFETEECDIFTASPGFDPDEGEPIIP